MEAIILAGGLGTRLREVLPDHPKPMAPVAGRPFLEYLLDHWIDQGVSRFILSVGYKHDVIRAHFADRYRGVPLAYAVEPAPLGTGGGILLAMQHLNSQETFLALNGDTFFGVSLHDLSAMHKRNHADMTIALHRSDEVRRYLGVELGASQRLLGFRQFAGSGATLVNGGVYLIEPRLLSAYEADPVPLSLENDILPDLVGRKALLYGFPTSARFLDIGLPSDYERAGAMLTQ